jgi:cyclic pyranopterin phosphate synthase
VTDLTDSYGRRVRKLRISVTDRCNFRCQFCMPEDPVWLPREDILTFEEICRVASLFVGMGVNRIRLSGGEPLMRQDIERLISLLSENLRGVEAITMTTNGILLADRALALRKAGLTGITVSLHSLKPPRFKDIAGGGDLRKVIAGIEAARKAGFNPVKVNAVIIRGCNEDEIVDLASLARTGNITMRFIEYMPFDGKRLWGMDKVMSGNEILEKVRACYKVSEIPREAGSTAKVYRFADGGGEIGIITSITEPFCSDCERIRLSADGKIVPCLFDSSGFDLKPLLRGGSSDQELSEFIRNAVQRKAAGVKTLLKEFRNLQHVRPMYTIGG